MNERSSVITAGEKKNHIATVYRKAKGTLEISGHHMLAVVVSGEDKEIICPLPD